MSYPLGVAVNVVVVPKQIESSEEDKLMGGMGFTVKTSELLTGPIQPSVLNAITVIVSPSTSVDVT